MITFTSVDSTRIDDLFVCIKTGSGWDEYFLVNIKSNPITGIVLQICQHIVCFIALNKIICKHKELKLLVN